MDPMLEPQQSHPSNLTQVDSMRSLPSCAGSVGSVLQVLLPLVLSLIVHCDLITPRVQAQDGSGGTGNPQDGFRFECGMAVVTCSSASRLNQWSPCGNGLSDLSPNAYVVGIIDTRDPVGVGAPFGSAGGGWTPAMWHNDTSTSAKWNAANLGEVFGIALDDATPPNIYVTATSIHYGNGRGPGGHGGVYRLSGTTYGISVFQDFTTSTQPVGSVSLGNICFDREHKQFFVTDLDHGLIRRLSSTGAELTTGGTPYDHGVTGRANISLPGIPDASGAPGDLTRSGRRVFGLQTYKSRLYYSVWYSAVAGGSATNEVWSVGLQSNGDPIVSGAAGPRKEFALQGLTPFSQYAGSEPVITDIAFSESGTMLIGERSICFSNPLDLASGSHAARAIEYTFNGTTWVHANTLQVGAVVGANNGRVNSAGGVDYDCDGHPFVMGDALINDGSSFPHTGNAVYGLQIFPTSTSVVSNSWLVDLDGNYTVYDKLSLGDVEVYRCCNCLTFSDESIQCTATNQFTWSFCYTNTGTLTNAHLVLVDLPPGVTVSPQILTSPGPILPGQGLCTNLTFTIAPGSAPTNLCFRIAAHTEFFEECCVVPKCLDLPQCCGVISKEEVKCDPATGNPTWTFQVQNFSGVPVQYLILVPEPPGCVGVPNPVITLSPPLGIGQSTTVSVPLNVTNTPCDTSCFRVSFHDAKFIACCSFRHCISLNCKSGNHPPHVDCPQHTVVCDPTQAGAFTLQTTVQDPDGDPLKVILKVDGFPIQTNAVPAGVSASPTIVSFTHGYNPGVHVVTFCVLDSSGSLAICDFDLTVGDIAPPHFTCPPDRVVNTMEFVVPDFTGQIEVTDDCAPRNLISVTQDPAPGTVWGPGLHCVTLAAVDPAGNRTECRVCIRVVPLAVIFPEAASFVFGVPTQSEPGQFLLAVEGALSQTESVDYFANDQFIGRSSGPGFRWAWSGVTQGIYSIVAEGTHRTSPASKSRSLPVTVFVTPPFPVQPQPGFSSTLLENGQLKVTVPTVVGGNCSIEITDSLANPAWRTLQKVVGDGKEHTLHFGTGSSQQFFRIRME